MKNIGNYFINYLIRKQIIKEEDREIYHYGIYIFLFKCIYAFSVIFLCLMLQRSFIELALFYFSYMSIRKYSGGYHAKNMMTCLIIFIISYLFLNPFTYVLSQSNFLFVYGLLLFIIAYITYKSPIDCANKPLDDTEKQKYKSYTLYACCFWLIASILITFFNHEEYASCIHYSILLIAAMLIKNE